MVNADWAYGPFLVRLAHIREAIVTCKYVSTLASLTRSIAGLSFTGLTQRLRSSEMEGDELANIT